jgi:hypothetical protein
MNPLEPYMVDWIKYADVMQDMQWYAKHMCDMVYNLLIYVVLLIALPNRLKILGLAYIAGQLIDIPNYWLFYHQFDWAYKSLFLIISLTYIKLKI